MITLNQVRLKTREMILKDIDFTFEKGNIYGMVAINGFGKTTLFRAISRLISIGGLVLGINVIEPLQKVAHFIPFTYLRSVEIFSGRLPQNIQTAQLKGNMGIIVIPIFIIILFVCIF